MFYRSLSRIPAVFSIPTVPRRFQFPHVDCSLCTLSRQSATAVVVIVRLHHRLATIPGCCNCCLKKNLNASIDLLSIPHRGGNVETLRWDHGLQQTVVVLLLLLVGLFPAFGSERKTGVVICRHERACVRMREKTVADNVHHATRRILSVDNPARPHTFLSLFSYTLV